MATSKKGTPQKNKARTIPSGKVQVNYNMDGDKAEKFKTIAFNHGIAQSDVYNKAAEKFLQLYEKKYGTVTPFSPGSMGAEIKI